ncbi:MAG TPA: hypothetical protein VFT04_12690 [Gemmatimonadales bacterium]|nr:hypothetical protein [Gemmatimonadales bacterium]
MRRFAFVIVIGAFSLSACERNASAGSSRRAEVPPQLPLPGSPDSLLGLFVLPADSLARFETREHGYEESSAVVYGASGPWVLVGLADSGRTWLRRDRGALIPLEALLREGLSHLTDAWDGTLRFAPDAASSVVPIPHAGDAGEDVPAVLLGTRMVDGTLWLEIEVLDQICGADTSRAVAKGWIPAWTGGKPTMWFHSRGC